MMRKKAGLCQPFFVLLMAALVGVGCTSSEKPPLPPYDGPLRVIDSVDTYHTEHDRMKSRLQAPRVIEMLNGDREFPEGVYMEFFNEQGQLNSTLQAQHAYFFKTENQWRGRGNVIIRNLEKDQQLNTEELFWKPDTRKIFTDKFVTLRDAGDIVSGTGLEAMQDLSNYHIKKPVAEFEVDE